MKYTLILPVYNESGNLIPLVNNVLKLNLNSGDHLAIVAINDGSEDNSLQELQQLQKKYPQKIIIANHPTNRGFAAALKTGINRVLKTDSDVFLFMDADQTHNPDDLLRFTAAIKQGYDFVIGSRYIPGGRMIDVPKYRIYLSQIFNFLIRTFLFINLRDMTSGYRAIRRRIFETIPLQEQTFTIQMEEIIKAYALDFKFKEIPIALVNRQIGKSAMYYNFNTFITYGKLFLKCAIWRLGWFGKNPVAKK